MLSLYTDVALLAGEVFKVVYCIVLTAVQMQFVDAVIVCRLTMLVDGAQ